MGCLKQSTSTTVSHWKPRVNHLTHLSHSVSQCGQKDSFFTHFWVILSVYWPTGHYDSNESNDSLGFFCACNCPICVSSSTFSMFDMSSSSSGICFCLLRATSREKQNADLTRGQEFIYWEHPLAIHIIFPSHVLRNIVYIYFVAGSSLQIGIAWVGTLFVFC